MTQNDMLSINTVAARLGLSVHQLRRWELMFGLEIKRGRGQQRQYRPEDLTVLERIKELVEQGWPTSQIRPQLEAEGLITPKLIGMPQQPGNPEMLMEAIIGLRSFAERRFIEISRQIDELRQLMISITLKQELRNEISSPWQPIEEEFAPPQISLPAQEISIGPAVGVSPPLMSSPMFPPHMPVMTQPQPQPQLQPQTPIAQPVVRADKQETLKFVTKVLRAESPDESLDLLADETGIHSADRFIFWVDWRDEDEAIASYCEAILQTGKLSAKWEGDSLVLQYGDNQSPVPLLNHPADRHTTLCLLNEILMPQYELRLCKATADSDTLAIIPLNTETWDELERTHGIDEIAQHFEKLSADNNLFANHEDLFDSAELPPKPARPTPPPVAPVAPVMPAAASAPQKAPPILGEITDQNYLTMLGKALDLVGWSDEQADSYSMKSFGVAHWDELGRSQAEKLIDHLLTQLMGR